MKLSQDRTQTPYHPPIKRGRRAAERWYLVANGQSALIFREEDGGLVQLADITPTDEFTPTEAQKTRGNQPGGQGSVYYTSDPMDREDDHDESVFLKNVSGWLKKSLEKHGWDELVIAASPNALGLLRGHLDHLVKDKIIREIDKDYTNTPLAELETLLIR